MRISRDLTSIVVFSQAEEIEMEDIKAREATVFTLVGIGYLGVVLIPAGLELGALATIGVTSVGASLVSLIGHGVRSLVHVVELLSNPQKSTQQANEK